MKKRNLALCIVFSIISFGIYALYWLVMINNNTNELANPPKKTSGAVVIILNIVTCGIYGWFWAHKMGKLQDEALVQRGMAAKNSSVIYVVLSVLGLGIVAWLLMQNTLNSMIN